MKILITEDHAVVREGLKLILADHFKKAVFGEARNATDALDLVWKEKWDVVVLDITMPGRSGLEVLKEIKRSRPKLPVLVLSMHPEDQFAVRLLKAGAAGYLTKESAAEELVGAIKKVVAGGRYISPTLAERMAEKDPEPKPDLLDVPFQRLSEHDLDALRDEILDHLDLLLTVVLLQRSLPDDLDVDALCLEFELGLLCARVD